MKGFSFRRFSLRQWIRKIALGIGVLLLLQILIVILLRWLPVYITPLMVIREVQKIGTDKKMGFSKTWRSREKLSDHLKVAVICSEDQRFFAHMGFDLKAIEKAIDYNEKQQKRGRKKQRGASTISQQTAKNVFLWPQRSWVRKGLEVWFTLLIEIFWSKQRILEVYLNVAEMGDSIYGAEAAAKAYWKQPAAKLTADRSALLAAILPSPRRYSAARPGPYVQSRQSWIRKQMRFNGPLYEKVKD
jgi:monofunctional glycosyltransferase